MRRLCWTSGGTFADLCNHEMVGLESVEDPNDEENLRSLIEEHYEQTGSVNARRVLDNWEAMLPLFVKVMPHDYKRILLERAAAVAAD